MEGSVPLIGGAAVSSATTCLLFTAAFVASIGAGGFGYGAGVPNMPQATIEGDLNLPHNGIEWAAVVATFSIFALIGSQFTAGLVDKWGRKAFLTYIQLLFLAGGGLSLAAGLLRSQQVVAYALLICGRALIGIGSGAASVSVPLYLGEISPERLKGAFGCMTQLAITVLILIAQGAGTIMSTSTLWGWLLGVSGFLGIAGFLLSPVVLVESPKWLVAVGRLPEALAVLRRLRGCDADAAEAELVEIQASVAAGASTTSPSLAQLWRDPALRRALTIAVTLQVAQQLSGINAVFFFSTSFFTDAGLSNANYATLACGAVNVLATLLGVWLIERMGRKSILLLSTLGMLVAAAALTGTLVAKASVPSATTALGYVSVGFVLVFVSFFEFGMGPVPWLLGAELVPEGPRSTIMALAAGANWIFTTVIALAFGPVQTALGNYSFLPFCVFLALTVAFIVLVVPETKGRTAAEVLRGLAPAAGGKGGRAGSFDDGGRTAAVAPLLSVQQ